MIVPIVGENTWLPVLEGLPAFDPGSGPFLFVSPHPDDETLGAGGFLAAQARRGLPVTVVAVTDGEHAYTSYPGLREVRVREQEQALRILCEDRAKLVRFALTDSGVSTAPDRLAALLEPLVSQQTHVLAPWEGDFHPDHEACGRVAAAVARRMGARLSWYFFWTWHRGTPAAIEGLALRRFTLDAALQQLKCRALRCHVSQLDHPSNEPILPANLLAPASRGFEVFAAL